MDKTTQNTNSIKDYIDSIGDEQSIRDSYTLLEIMQRISSHEPKLWNERTIGFGSYHYKYDSGREGDFMHKNKDICEPPYYLAVDSKTKDTVRSQLRIALPILHQQMLGFQPLLPEELYAPVKTGDLLLTVQETISSSKT